MSAYIMVKTAVRMVSSVAQKIRSCPGVISVHPVVGSYDIVVLIEGKDLKEIGDRVTGDIHSIDGIVETMTLPVVEIK